MGDPLDELAIVPPAEFVAARSRVAADLKAAGDAETAARVAKLRRPSQINWAINATVREHPELAATWAAAAEDARDAGASELRAALTEVRAAATALSKAVGKRASAGDAAQVLAQAASDAHLTAAVASGTLGFDVDQPRPLKATAGSRAAAKRQPKHAKEEPARSRAAVERAEQAVQEARAALDEARTQHTAAEAALDAAAAELDEARQRAQQAEREHLAAQRRRAATDRLVAEAEDDLARTEKRLAAAERDT